MPRLRKNEIPSLRLHKASGRAIVTLNGKDHPCGQYGSPEAKKRYEEIVSQWIARGRRPLTEKSEIGITIEELCARYLEYSKSYYVKHGRTTSAYSRCKTLCASLSRMFGSSLANDFTPKDLKTIRDYWVELGIKRSVCNTYTRLIILIFGWGISEEIVNPSVCHALREVPSLKKGRTKAGESEPVKMAAVDDVQKIIGIAAKKRISEKYANIMRIQLLTAMRPGEVCSMRPCNITKENDTWIYKPDEHKTEHAAKKRSIVLGPKTIQILEPLIDRCESKESYIFKASNRHKRKNCVDPNCMQNWVSRTCEKNKIRHFSPNQIRHTALSLIRKKYGLEAGRIVAGHSDAATTTIYAEIDEREIADKIAREIG